MVLVGLSRILEVLAGFYRFCRSQQDLRGPSRILEVLIGFQRS